MERNLILSGAPPWNPLLSGALLGLITLALLWYKGKALGVSTGFENLCSLGSRLPYFQRSDLRSSSSWRLPFTGGLVLGGLVSALLLNPNPTWIENFLQISPDPGVLGNAGREYKLIWDLGLFDQVIGWGHGGKMAWMFFGGLLIGFGTRLAGGCTSGHGIYGMGNLEKGSFASTFSYFAAGILTTYVIYHLIFAGSGALS